MAEATRSGDAAGGNRAGDWLTVWRQWPNKLLFGLLLAVWVALFHFLGSGTFGYVKTPSLFAWLDYVYRGSEDDQHSYLIPFVVLGLLYYQRRQLLTVSKAVWWPALGLLMAALLLHVAGYLIQFPQVSAVAFFGGLYALTGLAWGRAWLRATFFPMVLFAFCVPLGSLSEPIAFPLRMLATRITVFICNGILGMGVIRDGALILDPSGQFHYEVAAACGGIRSLIAMSALTTIFAFVQFRSPWRRILVIASAVPLAVLGNVFRLFSIILAAKAFDRAAGDFVHERLGLLPYLPVIVGLILLGYWLREPDPEPAAPQQSTGV